MWPSADTEERVFDILDDWTWLYSLFLHWTEFVFAISFLLPDASRFLQLALSYKLLMLMLSLLFGSSSLVVSSFCNDHFKGIHYVHRYWFGFGKKSFEIFVLCMMSIPLVLYGVVSRVFCELHFVSCAFCGLGLGSVCCSYS